MDTFETVYYTLLFIVPGFVMAQIIDSMCPKAKTEYGFHLIRCLYLSMIADIFGFLIVYYWRNEKEKIGPFFYWIFLVAFLTLSACLISVLIGFMKRSQFWRKPLAKIGIYVDHSIPYAWEYVFARGDYEYLRIRLIDGTLVIGLYASKSFSSTEPDDRDIFLEQLYDITEDSDCIVLIERQGSKGILIRGNQIGSIEFLNKEKVTLK